VSSCLFTGLVPVDRTQHAAADPLSNGFQG
jgi:hypothetical protein